MLGQPEGGLGVIARGHIPHSKFYVENSNNFECMEIQFNCASDKIVAHLVYRPAGHITNDFLLT